MAVTHICIYRHIDAKEEEKERANKTDQKREWSVSGGIERVKEEERNARSAAAAVCSPCGQKKVQKFGISDHNDFWNMGQIELPEFKYQFRKC